MDETEGNNKRTVNGMNRKIKMTTKKEVTFSLLAHFNLNAYHTIAQTEHSLQLTFTELL